jgi:hypothetical protein
MGQYWRELDAAWQGLPTESGSIYSLHLVFGDARLGRLDSLLRAAESVVGTEPTHSLRMAMARDGFHNASDFMVNSSGPGDGRSGEGLGDLCRMARPR